MGEHAASGWSGTVPQKNPKNPSARLHLPFRDVGHRGETLELLCWKAVLCGSRQKARWVWQAKISTGRSSGGLELYITKPFEPTLLLSSPHHIAVDAQGFTIIGVYYQPTTDYDDLVLDLTSILKKVKNPEKVIIGGDFNIRPDSSEFSELAKILSQWRITLLSNPGVPTHTNSQRASVLDHILTSDNLTSPASYVHQLAVSDHLPISVTFKMPRNFHHLGVNRKGRCVVNVQECLAQLKALQLSIDTWKDYNPTAVAQGISQAFQVPSLVQARRKGPKTHWFNSYH